MLLDDEQAALNELVGACRESADHYEDAAERIDDAGLRELFGHVRAARLDSAERLAAAVRETGELPRAPNTDREGLDQLITHVKATFADDARGVFLDSRIEDERRIEGLARDALALELGDAARACVGALLAHATETLGRLVEARAGTAP